MILSYYISYNQILKKLKMRKNHSKNFITLSHFIGSGMIWKVLSSVLISTCSLIVFLLKHIYDLEFVIEDLNAKNIILEQKIDNGFNIIAQNQNIIMKNQGVIAEDSYLQYLTMKNICYFTLAVVVIGGGIYFYYADPFGSTLESLKDTNNLVSVSQKNISGCIDTFSKNVQDNHVETISYLDDIRRVVCQQGSKSNNSLDKTPDIVVEELGFSN